MKIDEQLMSAYSSEVKSYKEKEPIFLEGDTPAYYFQIVEGKVKVNNYNEDGKEFIHNILGEGQSFGDPFLFVDKKYPVNAFAEAPTKLICIPRKNFINLIRENQQISMDMNACLANRLYYKSLMMQNMTSQKPATRISAVFDYLKSYSESTCDHSFGIQLTRQQIADFTGLRVETIIRTLKKMKENGTVKIQEKKIYY